MCSGFDLVLSNGTLYELNREYAMSNGTPSGSATTYQYALGGYTFQFAVPPDRTQPLLIEGAGATMTSSFSTTTTTPTSASSYESTSTQGGNVKERCDAQPPVNVW